MSTLIVNNIQPASGNTVTVVGDLVANVFYGDGSQLSGISGGTATPSGNNGEIQFNDNGSFGSSSALAFVSGSDLLNVNGTVSATTFYGDGSNITNIPGVSPVVTKTKAEMDAMILAEELVVGQTYMVTGVDTELYGGTDIMLKAAATNMLCSQGHGIFYNPRYENGKNGNGVWTRYFRVSMVEPMGYFNPGELVYTDNYAFGRLWAGEFIEWIDGDWSLATSMQGYDSGAATNLIGSANTPSYSTGDSAIWGGKKWVLTATGDTYNQITVGEGDGSNNFFNFKITGGTIVPMTLFVTDGNETFTEDLGVGVQQLAGSLGGNGFINYIEGEVTIYFGAAVASGATVTATYFLPQTGTDEDMYTLNSNWSAVVFNTTDYDLVVDEIEYDYANDLIVARKDKYGNEVVTNYSQIVEGEQYNYGANAIRDFQWGNVTPSVGFDEARYNFSDEISYDNSIDDGGNDMYDGANILSADNGDSIPYTHTRMATYLQGGYPDNNYEMDGSIQDGSSYFNGSAQYFTNMYPGLFVMMADGISINSFKIDGNIGADGSGLIETDSYDLTGYSQTYGVFVKKQYDSKNEYESEADPSINHIFIVNTSVSGVTHDWDPNHNDDFDEISGITGATWIACMVTSKWPGDGYIDKATIDEMVTAFIGIVDGNTLSQSLEGLNAGYPSIIGFLPTPQNHQTFGVYGNRVIQSYMDCLNFTGGIIAKNTLTESSSFKDNIFVPDILSVVRNNSFKNESFFGFNRFSVRAKMENNSLDSGYIAQNSFGSYGNGERNSEVFDVSLSTESSLYGNQFLGAGMYNGNITNSSYLVNFYIFDSYLEFFEVSFDSGMEGNEIYQCQLRRFKVTMASHFDQNQIALGSFDDNEFSGRIAFANNDIILTEFNSNLLQGGQRNSPSFFTNNYLFDSTFRNNRFTNKTSFNDNSVSYSEFEYNNVSENSAFDANNIEESNVYYNEVRQQSSISDNGVTGGSYLSGNRLFGDCHINENIVDNNSSIENNYLERGCSLDNNNLNYSSLYSNVLETNSYLHHSTMTNESEMYSNTLRNSCTISNNEMDYAYVDHNELAGGCMLHYNTLGDNSAIAYNQISSESYMQHNNMTGGSQVRYNVISSNSNIEYCGIHEASINNNSIEHDSTIGYTTVYDETMDKNRLFDSTFSFGEIAGSINNTDARGLSGSYNLSGATAIYALGQKNIFKNSANNIRLSYYDASDLLVVTDITA